MYIVKIKKVEQVLPMHGIQEYYITKDNETIILSSPEEVLQKFGTEEARYCRICNGTCYVKVL